MSQIPQSPAAAERPPLQHPNLQKGDVVIARIQIVNDGSVPGADENEIFAEAGTKGMLINIGYIEEDPDQELFLVCFENANGELGAPVTCLAEEIEPLQATEH